MNLFLFLLPYNILFGGGLNFLEIALLIAIVVLILINVFFYLKKCSASGFGAVNFALLSSKPILLLTSLIFLVSFFLVFPAVLLLLSLFVLEIF